MPEIHKIVNYAGKQIHYRDEGRSNVKTIVLLHGLAQNLTVWSDITLKLMGNYRVVLVDLPGHGYTDLYNKDVLTMEFMAECVHEVLIAAGVSDCVIVGHSLGGYVALAYAEKYEHTVKGLGLINSHALADDQQHLQDRRSVCEAIRTNRPNFIINFVPSLFSNDCSMELNKKISQIKESCLTVSADALIASEMGMARRISRLPFLSKTSMPIMFVYGKDDTRIPLELASIMATVPQHSEMLLLDHVGHMAHIEEPHTVVRWIRNFIETCYADPRTL
ncbi:MAG: alpha/beta hydrolase [Bacteroidales bacterium]|nr:alpha/beta hydrolase [Bacteroidales bacterium]